MKKILILSLISLAFVFTSCDRDKADEDVETAIKQLNLFNNTFEEMYADGVISKEAPNEKEKSEYDKLKKLASQYYETMNKINKNVKEEKDRVTEGKESHGYEEAYKEAIEANKADIETKT